MDKRTITDVKEYLLAFPIEAAITIQELLTTACPTVNCSECSYRIICIRGDEGV